MRACIAAFLGAAVLASAAADVQVCGHDNPSCRPVSSTEFFFAVAVFTLFPFLIAYCTACGCVIKDNSESINRWIGGLHRNRAAAVLTAHPVPAPSSSGQSLPDTTNPMAQATSGEGDAAEGGEGGGGGQQQGWRCPVCTFRNSAADGECRMCGTGANAQPAASA